MRYERVLYLATVFLTGAAVLITEVAAIRLLSIQFGSSMEVVSGVLAVILLALSFGYYVGGRLSDRFPTPLVMYGLILSGGLLLLAFSSIAYTLLHPALVLDTAIGPLGFSLLIFFLPAFLLGMDSPFAIKLLTKDAESDQHGKTVGQVFFWSTTGSILGSLAAGFSLLPVIGVLGTLYSTSAALVLLGLIGYALFCLKTRTLPSRRQLILLLVASGFIVLLVLGTSMTNDEFAAERGVIYEGDGLYSHILITEREAKGRTVRALERDINNSSAIYPGSTDIVYDYLRALPDQIELHGNVRTMLQIGGGAFTGPKAVHERYPDITIDVVEIEPILYDLAIEYFELPVSDRIRNFPMDGRVYLEQTDMTYDLIYLDAFNSGHFIPPNLVSREFYALVRERLEPNGLVVLNFIGVPSSKSEASVTGSLLKTLNEVFENVVVYLPNDAPRDERQNVLVHLRTNDLLKTKFSSTSESNPAVLLDDQSSLINEKDAIFVDEFPVVELLTARDQW